MAGLKDIESKTGVPRWFLVLVGGCVPIILTLFGFWQTERQTKEFDMKQRVNEVEEHVDTVEHVVHRIETEQAVQSVKLDYISRQISNAVPEVSPPPTPNYGAVRDEVIMKQEASKNGQR